MLRSFTAVYGARGQNPNFLTEDRRCSRTRPGLGARQAGGGAARGLLRAAATRRCGHRPALRAAVRPRRAHLLHARSSTTAWCRCSWATTRWCSSCIPTTRWPRSWPPSTRRAGGRLQRGAHAGPSRSSPRCTSRPRSRCPCRIRSPTPAADLLWAAGLGEAPGGFVDYVRYLFVADGEKARRELGFAARALQPGRARRVPALPPPARRRGTRGGGDAVRAQREGRAAAAAPPARRRAAAEPRPLADETSCADAARAAEDAPAARAARGPGPAAAGGRRGSAGRTWRGSGAPSTSPGTRRRSTSSATTRSSRRRSCRSSSSCTRCGGAWRRRGSRTCPTRAPALIVANHSGVLPWDGVMINLAVRHEHPARRECRMLALDMFALLPFLAPLLAQSGRGARQPGERRAPAAQAASWSASSRKA